MNGTINFMNSHAEYVGKHIDLAIKGTGIFELYKILAKMPTPREIFVFVYHGLVRSKQIDAMEEIPDEKKKEIWEEVLNVTRDMPDSHKGSAARTNLARCIYLIKISTGEYQ